MSNISKRQLIKILVIFHTNKCRPDLMGSKCSSLWRVKSSINIDICKKAYIKHGLTEDLFNKILNFLQIFLLYQLSMLKTIRCDFPIVQPNFCFKRYSESLVLIFASTLLWLLWARVASLSPKFMYSRVLGWIFSKKIFGVEFS